MWSIRLKNKTVQILAALGICGLMVIPAVVSAQAVTQSYGVTGSIQKGMIVMLDSKNTNNVEPLTNKKDSAMQGVVVSASDSAVTLSGDGSTNQVYVATTGKYNVLVSNQNGPIKAGDIISISALDGIGMKADTTQSVILGKALEAFNGTNHVSGTTQLTTSTGSTNVSLGLIQVNIGISHNPLAASGTDGQVPSFLRKAADAIAGKPVGAPRIYIGLAILLATFIIAGSLLYGGVRSSMVAIGRNPLARGSVLRGLFQVMFIGLIIFVVGLLAIYLLLKL
jgi:hypothetical protein